MRDHCFLRLLHELVGEPEAAVRAQHRDGRDVPAGLGLRVLLPVLLVQSLRVEWKGR